MSQDRDKPRILRVVSRMAIGGVQRGILATLARADRERFDYAVLCTKKEGRWAPDLRAIGIPVHFQKTLPPWNPFQIARLARLIARLRPDLVHVHMAPMVIPAVSAARLAGVRHVVIQHHNHYDRHWAAENALLRRWEWRLTRGADAVIAVSQSVAECTLAHVRGQLRERTVTIPNGLELDKFLNAEPRDPRPEWGLPPATPLVVHVARYLETKRIEDFIAAAAVLKSRWSAPGPHPVFVVIGGGAEYLHARYAAEIARLGAGDWVLLAGTREDVPAILRTAQVGALASEMEGFGQVLLEYLAAGLPVAATTLGPITEMLGHEREALLSPPRQPEALAAHIERLLLDRALATRLVEAGRARLPRYTWDAAVRGYEALYERVLGG